MQYENGMHMQYDSKDKIMMKTKQYRDRLEKHKHTQNNIERLIFSKGINWSMIEILLQIYCLPLKNCQQNKLLARDKFMLSHSSYKRPISITQKQCNETNKCAKPALHKGYADSLVSKMQYTQPIHPSLNSVLYALNMCGNASPFIYKLHRQHMDNPYISVTDYYQAYKITQHIPEANQLCPLCKQGRHSLD